MRCRPARLMLICAALGLLTSALLALGSRLYHARFPPKRPPLEFTLTEGDRAWDVGAIRGFGRLTMIYSRQPPPGSGWQTVRDSGAPDPVPLTWEPAWARRFRLEFGSGNIGAYGWPVRCLKSLTAFGARGTPQNIGSVAIPRWLPMAGVRVPVAPIWAGMAADTLVWGAAWGPLLVGVSALRGRSRRRHGRCTACGYELMGSLTAFPECGHGQAMMNGAERGTTV